MLGDVLLGHTLLGDVLLGHTLLGVENCRLPLKHAKGMSLRDGANFAPLRFVFVYAFFFMVCLVLEDLGCLKCVSLRLQSKFLLEKRSCSNYYS